MIKWKRHQFLQPPTDAEIARMEPDELLKIHQVYHEAIENAEKDPLKYGFELDPWHDADKLLQKYDELMVCGGNRSSKTTFGARTIVNCATKNSDGLLLCFAQDETASIRVQQKAVYEWLPYNLKQTIRSDTGYIKYGLKNGFTKSEFIIPGTKTTVAFHTYSQFLNNPAKFEGLEVGSLDPEYTNVGIWLDEYLLGPDLVDTLRFRLATRNSKLLLTFTSIDGETEFVSQYTKGAKTVKDRYVDRFPNVTENVPYIQEAKRPNAALIYFHSDKNPFGGWERLAKDLMGSSRAKILTRFYGVPDKRKDGQFPMFKRSINVLPHREIEQTVRVDSKCTRYMVIDPGEAKKWFMVWIAVAQDGTWYVYRDWPDKSYGDWAQWGQSKGGLQKSRLSDASRVEGHGIGGYKEVIEQCECGENIYERLIDPRAGARPKEVEEGTVDTIQQLEELGMIVLPAPGGQEAFGIEKLRDLMKWDDEEEMTPINRPKFYISDDCEQTIDSILNYTASEGSTEAWKDPIDCLKYAAAAEISHFDPTALRVTKQGSGGY